MHTYIYYNIHISKFTLTHADMQYWQIKSCICDYREAKIKKTTSALRFAQNNIKYICVLLQHEMYIVCVCRRWWDVLSKNI